MNENKEIYSYEVEAYALMTQVDRSVLQLNPVLQKYGYEFVAINIQDLERDFSDMVGLRKPYDPKGLVNLKEQGLSISNQFYETVVNSSLLGIDLILHGYVILLKRIQTYERKVVNYTFTAEEGYGPTNEMHDFAMALMHQLRLLKNDYASYLFQFHIARDTRTVVMRYAGFGRKGFKIGKLNMTTEEVVRFGRLFTGKIVVTDLSRIAFESFCIAHDIDDIKTQFITFMTALESIFNLGADQISHTVSRHLALVLSANKEEFLAHYRQIKKLYGTRSKIVHGDTVKTNLEVETDMLKTYTRQALQFSLTCSLSKKELFEELNAKGFS